MVETPLATVAAMLEGLARGDADAVLSRMTDDVAGVDEISRGWVRGAGPMAEYLDGVLSSVSELRSEVSDEHTTIYGDVALVTCMLHQTYLVDGIPARLDAPSSLLLRRVDGSWRICLFHTVPLPE